MFTRRRFLLSALAAAPSAALRTSLAQALFTNPLHRKQAPPPPPPFVFFGTETEKSASKGIYLSRFNYAAGSLTPPSLVAETPSPTFLALSPATTQGHRRLYAVNELTNSSASITSFSIDPSSGALTQINQVTSAGASPCYISLDDTGETAFVANYVGSTIATYRVLPNGALSQPVEHLDYKDPRFGKRGPNSPRQDIPHPHSVHVSPDNRFLLVSDLGSDEISVFTINPASAHLGTPSLFPSPHPGSGPRHLAFHPNGRWVYSINELDSSIDFFLWTTTSSRTDPQGLLVNSSHRVSTIAPGFSASKNTAAEVAVSPDGNFLYASNRGENTLVVFSIAPDGQLTFIQRISCGGRTPRHFTLDPTGRWILCGNQDSASVTVFRRDGGTGKIGGPVQSISIDSPMFTLFA